MTLETGYLSSRQVIEQSNGCQASGFATGRAARQISKIGVHRQGHAGMGPKILSGHVAQQVFVACVSLCVLRVHAQADTVPFCFLSPRVLCLSPDKHHNNYTTCHEAAVLGFHEPLSSGNYDSTTQPQGARQHEKPQLSGHPDAKRRRTGRHAAEPSHMRRGRTSGTRVSHIQETRRVAGGEKCRRRIEAFRVVTCC